MTQTLFVGSLLMTFVCFWLTLGFAVRAIQLRKPGLPLCPVPLVSPFQHLFAASHFSYAGLRARRVAFVSAVGLVVFAALDFLLS
jgi:hypothetical protein